MTSSISRQLILWLAIPLMLLALCGALVHYFNNVAPSVISSDRRLRDATHDVMAHISVDDGRIVFDASTTPMSPATPSTPAMPSTPSTPAATSIPQPLANQTRFAVRDAQGRLLYGDPQIPVVAISAETGQLAAVTQIESRDLRTLTTRFDTRAGVVIITVADLARITDTAARYGFMSTLLWDFVQLDVTLVLIWVGIRLGLRPIKRLREEIAARSPLDLRPIVESSVPREIAPVVVTLNRLFGMLRSSVQSQQQFIANTAHQLRTPLTGMQAQLDLLIAEPAAQPIQPRLLTLRNGVRQLARTSHQLLSLARADSAKSAAARREQISLAELVAEVVARFVDYALQRGIDLGVDTVPATLTADPSLLDDLLSNLVDNALKYTPAGGRVTVSTGWRASHPYLMVEDSGPGIAKEDRERVRQRFHRLPNAAASGTGLGLAIVQEIVTLYGGTLDIDSGLNGTGTIITVTFGTTSESSAM